MVKEDPSNLFGYDIVYLAKEETINNQLARIFAKTFHSKNVISRWLHRPKDIGDPIPDSTIVFGPPKIKILDNNNTKIDILFPYKTGTVIFDDNPLPLDGCSLKCTVDVKETVLKKENVHFSHDTGIILDKNNAMLDQDTLKEVQEVLNKNPFDLKQFFTRLNELKYGKDVMLDLSDSRVKWDNRQKERLGKMTEKLFNDFKGNDITLTFGFAPYKEDASSEADHKLVFTNIRVLPYFTKLDNSSGLVYCMVLNKERKLPPELPFKMELEAGEGEGEMILKRDILSNVVFDNIKNGAANYDKEVMGGNPFVPSFKYAAKETSDIFSDNFKARCEKMGYLWVIDKEGQFYQFIVANTTNADISVKETFTKDSNKANVQYDMVFKILEPNPEYNEKDNFRIIAEFDSEFEVIDGVIKSKDSEFRIVEGDLLQILKRKHWTKEIQVNAVLDTALMAKHFKWMTLENSSKSVSQVVSSYLGSIVMLGNVQFWYKNIRFVERHKCPLIFLTTTYKL